MGGVIILTILLIIAYGAYVINKKLDMILSSFNSDLVKALKGSYNNENDN